MSAEKEEFQFNHLYGVTVKVFEAKDLIKADALGLSDPFVVVDIDGQQRKTKVIKNTLTPSWNESFDFNFSSQPRLLKFNVWDWDSMSKNDPIGDASIDLTNGSYSFNTPVDSWIRLEHVKSGSLHIHVTISRIEQVVGRTEVDTNETASAISDLEHLLDFQLIEGSQLKSRDLFSKCDPVAFVTFGLAAFKTAVCPNNSNPVWNQICPVWTTSTTRDYVLKISVFDHEALGKSKLVGNAYIKPNTLAENKYYDFWIPLVEDDPKTDAALSELMTRLNFNPDNSSTRTNNSIHVGISKRTRSAVEEKFFNSVFAAYDTDDNGTIEIEELTHMLTTMGSKASDKDIETAFNEIDKNRSGKLTRAQLSHIFSNTKLISTDLLRSLHTIMLHGEDALHQQMNKGCLTDVDSNHLAGDQDEEVDNSGTNIYVQDRQTGLLVKENIPTYIKSALRLLYRTSGGQAMNKKICSTIKSLTFKQGDKMNNPKSAANIPAFIKTHKLNIDEILLPLEKFSNFNEFFYRKLKPGARTCAEPLNNSVVVSPADCRMMVFDSIDESKNLWIKGRNFSLGNLFAGWDKDGSMTALFNGGSLVIARLAPQDYHRWHFPVTGTLQKRFPIDGEYNTVNPIAIRKDIDVYTTNKRCICPIQTAEFGLVVLIAVGATMVGSINFNDPCTCPSPCQDGVCAVGRKVKKFDEHGYFAFGGSTTLVLFQPGAVAFDKDIKHNSNNQLETLVKVGNRIAQGTGKYEVKQ